MRNPLFCSSQHGNAEGELARTECVKEGFQMFGWRDSFCKVILCLFSSLQTIRFKSYLLSMGIANPVTRETYGSGTQYHMQLAKQLAGILQAPLEVKTQPKWFYILLSYFHVIRNLNKSVTPFMMWSLFNQHVIFSFW